MRIPDAIDDSAMTKKLARTKPKVLKAASLCQTRPNSLLTESMKATAISPLDTP